MFRHMILPVLLGVALCLLPTYSGGAALAEQVAKDFQPVSGYVVMPVEDEFLIDLDASRGIREGDLFAVLEPGEKVVHPVTKEVIGSLDEVRATLQVTRVKSGYSYVRPLSGQEAIERGAAIRRYANLPAVFWDYTGAGERLYTELRAALPQLEWRSYAQAQATRPPAPRAPEQGPAARVFFVYNQQGLGVKDGRFRPLAFYDRAASPAAAPAAGGQPPRPKEATAPAQPPSVPTGGATSATGIVPAPDAPSGGAAAIVRAEAPGQEGIRRGPEMSGKPAGLAVGDFDGDGRQETAVAFEGRIDLLRFAEDGTESLGSVDLGHRARAVALDATDLDGDGRSELYVTAADDPSLESLVVECRDGVYRKTITDIPWYLRVVDFPGQGPLLIGQSIGSEEDDFSGPVFRIARRGDKLVKAEDLGLPRFVDIYGFTPFVTGQGQRLFANLSINENLQVLTPGGEKLWESNAVYGGREAYIERKDPDAVRDKASRYLYLKARLSTGPDGEVLVPVNEGSRLVNKFRTFKSSHLQAMTWDGYALREAWKTRTQSGYLADFRLADIDNDGAAELSLAVLFSHEGVFSSPRSTLLIYELE